MKKFTQWRDVKEDSEFSENLFYDVDMSSDEDTQKAFHSNEFGSITILDRMTGFGYGIRDVETGYRDLNGEFWLASCNFNILKQDVKTVGQAIKLIKENANNCIGEEKPYKNKEEKLESENKRLREALELISNMPKDSYSSMGECIHDMTTEAKTALEATK